MSLHGIWRCIDAVVMSRVRQLSVCFATCYCCNKACRQMSTVPHPSPLPSTMSAWQLHEYGFINQLKLSSSVHMPVIRRPHDVLIRVHAASVNPVDVMMVGQWTSCFCGFCSRVFYSIQKFYAVALCRIIIQYSEFLHSFYYGIVLCLSMLSDIVYFLLLILRLRLSACICNI